jgi:hypothetical protein
MFGAVECERVFVRGLSDLTIDNPGLSSRPNGKFEETTMPRALVNDLKVEYRRLDRSSAEGGTVTPSSPSGPQKMTSRQCEIAAETYTACLRAQAGYDVLVQYGPNRPHYDLVAVKGQRLLPISVKGSNTGGWMLAVKYIRPGISYWPAIDRWLADQRSDVMFSFVQFIDIVLGAAPRVYIARPQEIAEHLKTQRDGKGHGALHEDAVRRNPRGGYKHKIPQQWVFSMARLDGI